MCKLHDWQAYDPDQFSFDRINDYRSHNQHNIQIRHNIKTGTHGVGCKVQKVIVQSSVQDAY